MRDIDYSYLSDIGVAPRIKDWIAIFNTVIRSR